MNPLNLLPARLSPPVSASSSLSRSISALGLAITPESDEKSTAPRSESNDTTAPATATNVAYERSGILGGSGNRNRDAGMQSIADEATPLLSRKDLYNAGNVRLSRWRSFPRRVALTVWNSIHWFLQALAAPGVYLLACFYDGEGRFAPLGAVKALFGRALRKQGRLHKKLSAGSLFDETNVHWEDNEKMARRLSSGSESGSGTPDLRPGRHFSSASSIRSIGSSSSYAISSESESDIDPKGERRRRGTGEISGRRGTNGSRPGDDSLGGDSATAPGASGSRRSVRIKLNDDAQRPRKHRKGQASSSSFRSSGGGGASGGGGSAGITKDILAQLKSPTSPAGALTKYPRMPAPPRPLIPRRQASYLNIEPLNKLHTKTLILDLDETLIHSMSKGGRMSTGHMVEVRLNTTFVGIGGQPSAGPQHPILYYVHKRPYCDEFLRRVSKWYNLVVFTASVQEYADPVIDWLETERKYFSARYYRQHCTFRHGAFIKDLSAVEPDLSKVMILDNSPLSYMFHQDNAIPIQGWISDHTDNDLLHLVPLLEGLQYVSDVRALLALRGGEDGRHIA